MLKNKKKVALIFVLFLVLIAIRTFEDTLFYDPFLNYFHLEYTHLPLPKFNMFKLFFGLGFRYYLNSIVSVGILYLLFKDSKIAKFSILLYMVLGSILLISFIFVVTFFGEENKMMLFYIRRFIIQPIFLILFIPAFYYQKKIK